MILAERRRPAAFLVLLRGKRCGLSCTIRRKREASCYYTENPEASRSAAIQRSCGPDMQGLVPLLDHRWESRHLRNDRTRLRLQPNPVLARMASPFIAGEVCVLHDGSDPSHINAVMLKNSTRHLIADPLVYTRCLTHCHSVRTASFGARL